MLRLLLAYTDGIEKHRLKPSLVHRYYRRALLYSHDMKKNRQQHASLLQR